MGRDELKLDAMWKIIEMAQKRTDGAGANLTPAEMQLLHKITIGADEPRVKLPVLKCYIEGEYVFAWCPMCRAWHRHGYAEQIVKSKIMKGRRIGQWVAHCRNPDAFLNYELSLYTKAEIEFIRESAGRYPAK